MDRELRSCYLNQAYPCVALHRTLLRRADPFQALECRTCAENQTAPGSVTLAFSDGGIIDLRAPPHVGRRWGHRGAAGFRVWKTKLRNVVNLFAPALNPILAGADSPVEPEPDEGDSAKWDQGNSRLFSLLFFVTSGCAHATVLTHEEAADGTAAWKALNKCFDAHTQEALCACHRERFGLRHVAGGNPIDFFTKGMGLKIHLQGLGEVASKEVYLDIMLSGLTNAPEFEFIHEMHYRGEFTSVDRLQETANLFYVDQQSRNASGPVVSGRGAAMAASSFDQCHRCKAYGHFQRDCAQQLHKNHPKPEKKWKNKRGGGGRVPSQNGAPTTTPPRTAMLSVRNSRSFA